MMWSHRRRGANAIEFALIALPLFLLIMGTMEYAWSLFHQNMLDSAVREAARVASRIPEEEDRLATGAAAAQSFWQENGMRGELSIQINSDSVPGVVGVHLVTAEGQVAYGRLLNGLVPVPSTLRATFVMRDEVLNPLPTL